VRQVATGWCEYAQPAPDGSAFVCAAAAAGGRYDLAVVTTSGARRALTTTRETEFAPSWSPDGAWIAFSRDVDGRWELLRIRPDGSGEEVVAPEGVFPTWTPRGDLAWTGPGGIEVAPADGSATVSLAVDAQFLSWR
jgi:Tol biopolymer transport system component